MIKKNPFKKKKAVKEVAPVKVKKNKDTIGEFLRIQDINGYFKYNINPSFIEAKVEKMVTSQMKGGKAVPIAWIMAFAVVFIAAGIAYVLISGQSGSSQCMADLKNCYATCAPAAQAAVRTAGGSAALT